MEEAAVKYEPGTLKVIWIGKDLATLHSRMFPRNQAHKAMTFAGTKREGLLMQLVKQKGDTYTWKIVPGAQYGLYLTHVYYNRLLLLFRP